MIAIALLVLAGLTVCNTLLVIATTGKPRKPITAATAAVVTTVQALYVVIFVLAAVKLGA